MYDIDFKNVKKGKIPGIIAIVAASILILIYLLSISGSLFMDHTIDNNYNGLAKKDNNSFLITDLYFLFMPGTFLCVGIWLNVKVNKRIAKLKKLNQTGILIKNLPYELVKTGTVINGNPIMAIQAEYTLPNGSKVKLKGDGIYNDQRFDNDGLVDLVIDPNDYSNYYLNFSINRINGNYPNDYYINKKEYMNIECPNCGSNKYDENDNCLYCGTKVIVKSYTPNK